MLKVLYLPLNEQLGTYDAFNAVGVQLEIFDFYNRYLQVNNVNLIRQEFLDKVAKFQPNLIHMQLQFTGLIDSQTINRARELCSGVIITNWSGDVRHNAPNEFVSVANALDYSFISSTGQLDLYRQAGCKNVNYWQIGYDPKFHYPLNQQNFKYDVSFAGNHYGSTFPDGNIRLEAANVLSNTFGARFGLFGTGYPRSSGSISPRNINSIYNDSMCTLSISHFNDVSHYFSDRLLGCMASGRPTITWYFPGCESYFVEGNEIFIARSNQDIVDIVNYCKANPDIANKIGINGYRRVFREHTFTSKIIELLHITKLINLV